MLNLPLTHDFTGKVVELPELAAFCAAIWLALTRRQALRSLLWT